MVNVYVNIMSKFSLCFVIFKNKCFYIQKCRVAFVLSFQKRLKQNKHNIFSFSTSFTKVCEDIWLEEVKVI